MQSIKDYFDHNIDVENLRAIADECPMSENAQWLLEQRYLATRYDPEINGLRKERDFAELVRRVSRVIASAETLYSDDVEWIRTLEKNIAADMLSKRFCFNSPCLFNAGADMITAPTASKLIYKSPEEMLLDDYKTIYKNRHKNQQLFACFVIDIPDSIEGIFNSVKDAAIISKFGGGVGANFGHIREKGAKVHDGGNGGVASGPVSFMRTWDTMADVVVQGGKRRAALMGMLSVDHPDIMKFINCKTEDGELPYFNISVAITDHFMEEAETDNCPHLLMSLVGNEVAGDVDAKGLFNKLCEAAWQRGDPGVFFIDTANRDNLLRKNPEYRIESTNPCGEQPLPNYTSCNLGSINVSEFIADNGDNDIYFDTETFVAQVIRSMYYLDLVIDASVYPLEKIEQRTKAIRPVGLGIMGLADAFIKLKAVYGSKLSTYWADFIARTSSTASLAATVLNPKEPFSFAEEADLDIPSLKSTLSALLSPKNVFSGEEARFIHSQAQAHKFRNSRRLSIAPTGSISMLFDTSPGIEPNFAWHWTRKVTTPDGGTEEREYWHPLLTDDMKQRIRNGEALDELYVTAHEVTPEQHVDMAAIFAPYIDSGISKTVNLPNSATVEDVKQVYLKAYKAGLKGITVYRDGSRSTQPIETKPSKNQVVEYHEPDEEYYKTVEAYKRWEELRHQNPNKPKVKVRPAHIIYGKTIKETTPWGSIYVTLNFDGSEPFETFINVGKSGSELKAMTEALARVISIGLRSGCRLEDFIATLKGLSGKEYWMLNAQSDKDAPVRSIPDAISALLDKLKSPSLSEDLKNQDVAVMPPVSESSAVCPECNSPMERVNGCFYCFNCGYSPCK